MSTLVSDRAIVKPLPSPKSWTDVFHHVQIEHLKFRGLIFKGGPLIEATDREWNQCAGQVSLGVCGITYFEQAYPSYHVRPNSWWIVKYSSEARINITSLSERGRAALAHEFGIAIRGEESDDFGAKFLTSPAFTGLMGWVKAHPRKAREYAQHHSPYVQGWYEMATHSTIHRVPHGADADLRAAAKST